MSIDARINTMIQYLIAKVECRDWHAVADAAMDLRELEVEKRLTGSYLTGINMMRQQSAPGWKRPDPPNTRPLTADEIEEQVKKERAKDDSFGESKCNYENHGSPFGCDSCGNKR